MMALLRRMSIKAFEMRTSLVSGASTIPKLCQTLEDAL
jgi:hypothetical protein